MHAGGAGVGGGGGAGRTRTNANIASASHDSLARPLLLLRHSYACRDFGLGPPTAGPRPPRARGSERASGGGERSPINSRWIFAADGDLQHISTQRTRAPPTRSRTMTLPVREVQFQTRSHNMTEGREHPPTNKHSPPAPTSPFTPGRPIYLSLSLPPYFIAANFPTFYPLPL